MPSSIPPDLYDRVFDLATAITSASEASDDAAYAAGVAELRALFEECARQGRSHPFLTEALADYTEDAKEAIELYQLALQQCVAFDGEPTHTKHIGPSRARRKCVISLCTCGALHTAARRR